MKKKCQHCIFFVRAYELNVTENDIRYYDEPDRRVVNLNAYVCTTVAIDVDSILIIDDPKELNRKSRCPGYTESPLSQALAKLLRKDFLWT